MVVSLNRGPPIHPILIIHSCNKPSIFWVSLCLEKPPNTTISIINQPKSNRFSTALGNCSESYFRWGCLETRAADLTSSPRQKLIFHTQPILSQNQLCELDLLVLLPAEAYPSETCSYSTVANMISDIGKPTWVSMKDSSMSRQSGDGTKRLRALFNGLQFFLLEEGICTIFAS